MNKAPDKIYMHAKEVQNYQEPYGNWKIEYIRKDALLEWIEKTKEKISSSRGYYGAGQELAYEYVIDKLNSM